MANDLLILLAGLVAIAALIVGWQFVDTALILRWL